MIPDSAPKVEKTTRTAIMAPPPRPKTASAASAATRSDAATASIGSTWR